VFPDQKERPLAQVRPIRDEIEHRVEQLVHELEVASGGLFPSWLTAS
jgi:hypothetical protein